MFSCSVFTSLGTVSYTHLDVYKRQSFGWCARGGFPERGESILARSLLGRDCLLYTSSSSTCPTTSATASTTRPSSSPFLKSFTSSSATRTVSYTHLEKESHRGPPFRVGILPTKPYNRGLAAWNFSFRRLTVRPPACLLYTSTKLIPLAHGSLRIFRKRKCSLGWRSIRLTICALRQRSSPFWAARQSS